MNIISIVFFHIVGCGAVGFESCLDAWKKGETKNQSYIMMDKYDISFLVYCAFGSEYGYSFLSGPGYTSDKADVSRLIPKNSKFILIRTLHGPSLQKETIIEQLDQFNSFPIGIFYSSHLDYPGPRFCDDKRNKYLYVGFLPTIGNALSTLRGYKANGMPYTFSQSSSGTNCHFAVYFNASCLNNVRQVPLHILNGTLNGWIKNAYTLPDNEHLPAEYFFKSYTASFLTYDASASSFNNTSVAIGLPFKLNYVQSAIHKTSTTRKTTTNLSSTSTQTTMQSTFPTSGYITKSPETLSTNPNMTSPRSSQLQTSVAPWIVIPKGWRTSIISRASTSSVRPTTLKKTVISEMVSSTTPKASPNRYSNGLLNISVPSQTKFTTTKKERTSILDSYNNLSFNMDVLPTNNKKHQVTPFNRVVVATTVYTLISSTCPCNCLRSWSNKDISIRNITHMKINSELKAKIEKIKVAISVHRSNTSAYRGRKICDMRDKRHSSKVMGIMSAILVICPLVILSLSDVTRTLVALWKYCESLF